MTADNFEEKVDQKCKTFASVAIGSVLLRLSQNVCETHAKEALVIFIHFSEPGHLGRGSKLSLIALTDNKSVTIFFKDSKTSAFSFE